MTPDEIIVGRLYKNKNTKDTYLGIGKRTMWTGNLFNTGEFDYKHLVIISSAEISLIGLIMKEGDECIEGIWENFYLV